MTSATPVTAPTPAPRPRLRPGTLLAWRAPGRLQVGVGAGAVVLEGLSAADELVVDALDGRHDVAALHRVAGSVGGTGARTDELLDALAGAGALLPAPGRGASPRRAGACAVVVGASATGLAVARGLAVAGVGTVVVEDDAPLTPADTGPGAHPAPQPPGRRTTRGASAAEEVARASPRTRTQPARQGLLRPDVVVLLASGAHDPRQADALVREGVPHLGVLLTDDAAAVGPLVRPGSSTCLRCLDLHRADRDPEWPRLVPQLAAPPGGPRRPEPAAVAALAGALAVQQALAEVDGAADPAALDATIEVDGEHLGVRPWSPHPRCGCTWATTGTTG